MSYSSNLETELNELALLVYFWKRARTWDQKVEIHGLLVRNFSSIRIDPSDYTRQYPDVCHCGKVCSETGSRVRSFCSSCHGNNSGMIEQYYLQGIPALYQEIAIAKGLYLYAKWIRRTNHST